MGKSNRKWDRSLFGRRILDWFLVRLEIFADRLNQKLKRFNRLPFAGSVLLFLVSGLLAFFIYHDFFSPYLGYQLGEKAERAVIAPKTIEIVDEETTRTKRQVEKEAVKDVYDLDQRRFDTSLERLKAAFSSIRTTYPELLNKDNPEDMPTFEKAKARFETELGFEVKKERMISLLRLGMSVRTEKALEELLRNINSQLITSNKELLEQQRARGVTLIQYREGDESKERIFDSFNKVVSWEQAKEDLMDQGSDALSWIRKSTRQDVLAFANQLVQPNLTFNQKETESRKKEAFDSVQPVTFRIEKGQVVVKLHETINERHRKILSAIRSEVGNKNTFYKYFFSTLFIFLILFSLSKTVGEGFRSLKPRMRDVTVCAVLLVGFILPTKLFQYISLTAFRNNEQFAHIPLDFFYYLMPVATAPMLIRMLIGKELASFFTIVVALISGFLVEKSFFFSCYVMVSCLMGVAMVARIQTRSSLYIAGLKVGCFNALFALSIFALTKGVQFQDLGSNDTQWIIIASVLSGLFSAILASVLAPLVENVFGYVTDIKLLELANLEHPLLKNMVIQAPGTYHHSLMIGNLVENAAKEIGANPLLARVMAMYHDIGKMIKPQYFIENQGSAENPHDKLSPSMSAMVIKEHVWGGIQMGKEHRIPRVILSGIPEHHGTSLITYFHNRHLQNQLDLGAKGEKIYNSAGEAIFRHDGPKPQTKETALLMLADAIEAATRSIKDPTVQKIRNMIQRIFRKVIDDGQLSDVDLTLRDLKKIEDSFVHHAVNMNHHRIEYDNIPKKQSEYSNANRVDLDGQKRGQSKKESHSTHRKEGGLTPSQSEAQKGDGPHIRELPRGAFTDSNPSGRSEGGQGR